MSLRTFQQIVLSLRMNVPVTPLVQRYASFYNGFFLVQQVVVKKPLHLVLKNF
ncbi:predicted protein [Enterococcus faecium 1,230,933]|nr:predicted protein [Enterococcus faecium 1,230,933]